MGWIASQIGFYIALVGNQSGAERNGSRLQEILLPSLSHESSHDCLSVCPVRHFHELMTGMILLNKCLIIVIHSKYYIYGVTGSGGSLKMKQQSLL